MEPLGAQSLVLGIPVPDSEFDSAVQWYVEVLGCEPVWKKGIAQLRLPSGQLLLLFSPEDDSDSIWYAGNYMEHPHYSVQFVVNNAAKLRERLIGYGAPVGEIRRGGGGGWDLMFHDPYGNRFWAIEDAKPEALSGTSFEPGHPKAAFAGECAVSERIVFRLTEESDLPFVQRAEASEHNALFVGQWTERQHRDAIRSGDYAHLLLADRATGEAIGYAILHGLEPQPSSVLLQRLVVEPKGKGYGREALRTLKHIVFNEWKAHRLWLDVRTNNPRAERLYQSEGFRAEGLLRDIDRVRDRYVSLTVMSILEDEYRRGSGVSDT